MNPDTYNKSNIINFVCVWIWNRACQFHFIFVISLNWACLIEMHVFIKTINHIVILIVSGHFVHEINSRQGNQIGGGQDHISVLNACVSTYSLDLRLLMFCQIQQKP